MTELSDPDNGIYFLDGDERVYNPVGQKTPPPPMWGDVLEEDLYDESTPFYDHELALLEKRERRKKEQDMYKLLPRSAASQMDGEKGPKLKRKVIYVLENPKAEAAERQGRNDNSRPPASSDISNLAYAGSQVVRKPTVDSNDYFNYNKTDSNAPSQLGSRR